MVRPHGFDDDEVADGLLDAFRRRGFARTSIPHLTAATRLLPGSLYAAFGSKDDMFRGAVERYAGRLGAELAACGPGLDGIRELLDTVVRLTANDRERRGCLVLNATAEADVLSAETRRALDRALDGMRRLIRERLEQAQAPAGTAVDLEPLEALVFGAAVAIRVLGRAGRERRLLQAIADGATAAVRSQFDTRRRR